LAVLEVIVIFIFSFYMEMALYVLMKNLKDKKKKWCDC